MGEPVLAPKVGSGNGYENRDDLVAGGDDARRAGEMRQVVDGVSVCHLKDGRACDGSAWC